MPEIIVNDLYYIYHSPIEQNVVLKGLKFTLEFGKIIVLAGSSGSGKTTLMKILHGVLQPSTGNISIPVGSFSGYIDQFSYQLLDQEYKVKDLIKFFYPSEDSKNLLQRIDMEKTANTPVKNLSVGEAQRLFYIISIHTSPDILLVDEATAQLDSNNTEILLQEFKKQAESGKLVVISTHDPRVIEKADQIIRLEDGYVSSIEKKETGGKTRFTMVPHTGNAVKIPDVVSEQWNNPTQYEGVLEGDTLTIKKLKEGKKVEEQQLKFEKKESKFQFKVESVEIKTPEGRRLNIPPTMTFPAGRITALVGPSGSGKSTFLDWCFGELRGAFEARGKKTMEGNKELRIVYLRQKDIFVNEMTFFDMTEVIGGQKIREQILKHLQYFNLTFPLTRSMSDFSGGQRYITSLCVGIARNPDILVLDETLANLDIKRKIKAIGLIKKLKDAGVAVIIATHEKRIVEICDEVYQIDKTLEEEKIVSH